MHLTTFFAALALPLLAHAFPAYPEPGTMESFSLDPHGVPFAYGICANETYPANRPCVGDVQAAIATFQSGVLCHSAPDAEGCNLIASYQNTRISLCGAGAPQDCGGVIKDTAEILMEECKLDDGTVGAWSRSRSGNGVVIWTV